MTVLNRLAPALSACGFATLLVASMYRFFLAPLKQEAYEMADLQIDPTDIVKVPYRLHRLSIYVAGVVFALILLAPVQNVQRIPRLAFLTAISYGVFVLCGASPVQNTWHSLLAAHYFAALLWMDPPVFPSTTRRKHHMSFQDQALARIRGRGSSPQDRVATAIAHGVVMGTIPLQILLLYDRGWQVQRWPVPVILGSTYGWVGGLLVGTIWGYVKSKQVEAHKE